MNAQIDALARDIVAQHAQRSGKHDRTLVAVAGPPGCGKSYVVEPLRRAVAALLQSDDPVVAISLDGWHMTRAELDAMPDPKLSHWQRGAAYTFSIERYRAFLDSLRAAPGEGIPYMLFDHAAKDPAPSPLPVLPRHAVVIIEGLYTLYDRPGWRECAEMMDVRVWIEVDPAVARARVIERNFAAGIVPDREASVYRVDRVDMVNAQSVRDHRVEPTHVVYSIDEA